jgi:hypothetical protein
MTDDTEQEKKRLRQLVGLAQPEKGDNESDGESILSAPSPPSLRKD